MLRFGFFTLKLDYFLISKSEFTRPNEPEESQQQPQSENKAAARVIPTIVVHEIIDDEAAEAEEGRDFIAEEMSQCAMTSIMKRERIIDSFEPKVPAEPLVKTTIAVSDVEGRAFDILLRY